jgi:hypothetical protein
MQQITDSQFKSLTQSIYLSFMGVSVACDCGETAELGMGEMGEARDTAEALVRDWCEQENITITD